MYEMIAAMQPVPYGALSAAGPGCPLPLDTFYTFRAGGLAAAAADGTALS